MPRPWMHHGKELAMPTLDWIGKKKMVNHHRDVSFRVLEKKYTYRDVSLGQSPLAQHDDCHSDDNEHCHSERSEESTDVSAAPQHDYYLGKHNGAGYWFYYKKARKPCSIWTLC